MTLFDINSDLADEQKNKAKFHVILSFSFSAIKINENKINFIYCLPSKVPETGFILKTTHNVVIRTPEK